MHGITYNLLCCDITYTILFCKGAKLSLYLFHRFTYAGSQVLELIPLLF